METKLNYKKCLICYKKANATGSHIVPASLIKECIGERNNEVSYNIDLINKEQEIFIGNDLLHKTENINNNNLKTNSVNPYILDYILCNDCEKKLGEIEGKVYSEIICKIREDKFQNNFQRRVINKFDVLIPISKRITINELNIYFYSIVLRVLHYLELNNVKMNVDINTIHSMSKFTNNLIYNLSSEIITLNTGLIVYITDNPKSHPTLLETNKFEKLIISVCNFIIILECDNTSTPFGDGINLISNKEFKFIKNSNELDEELFSIKNLLI